MSEKEKEKFPRKIKKVVFNIIQIVFGLLAMFLLLLMVIGVYLWVQSGFQNSIYLAADGFLFILFLGCCVVANKMENKLQEFRPRRKLTRESLKEAGSGLLAIIGIFILFYVFDSYIKLFPTTISATLTIEILKIVIQANGFLIGFSGIVFAQMFWAIHNQLCNIQMNILEKPVQELTHDIRRDYLTALENKRSSMMRYMFIVIGLFVVSILLSLSGMSQTEALERLPTNPSLTNPFLSMTFGIVFFVISIAGSKMSLEEDVKKIREKTEEPKEKKKD